MYNPDKLTDIYVKYSITPNQFYVLFLVYRKDWPNLFKYKENVKGFEFEELQPLIEKGYLEDVFIKGKERSSFEIIDLMVTPSFSDRIFIDSFEAGEELFKVYPHFLIISGQQVVAKKGGNINGKYYGKEEMMELYGKKICNSKEKHKWVLNKTEIANKKGIINFTLRDYIYDELWETFENLEDPGKKNAFI